MRGSASRVPLQYTRAAGYPALCPYGPAQRYPEWPDVSAGPDNHIYDAVRELLHQCHLDPDRFGSPQWNPFGDIIRPGMTVFIKPNTVSHENLAGQELFSVIVHASVLRPILDYVCLALRGQGRVIVGDSQIIHAEFDKAMEHSGIAELLRWYRPRTPVQIDCFDLRTVRGARSWMYGRWARPKVEQDPMGYQGVDLGNESYFRDIDADALRIAIASYKSMRKYHGNGRHEYVIPRSFLASDVVINVPKLKTHRRTAVTLALKNYMGIPAVKDCLPHFQIGAPSEGGDQYLHPSKRKDLVLWLHDRIQSVPFIPVKFLLAIVKKLVWNSSMVVPFKDNVYEGMWPGNDTLWRTLLDLNRIVLYADRDGVIRDAPQRVHFHLVDGVIGGQGDGPLSTFPVASNVLIGGWDPVAVDAVGATVMGFDIDKVPLICRALEDRTHSHPVCSVRQNEIRITTDGEEITLDALKARHNLRFAAHPNWVGQVELRTEAMQDAR